MIPIKGLRKLVWSLASVVIAACFVCTCKMKTVVYWKHSDKLSSAEVTWLNATTLLETILSCKQEYKINRYKNISDWGENKHSCLFIGNAPITRALGGSFISRGPQARKIRALSLVQDTHVYVHIRINKCYWQKCDQFVTLTVDLVKSKIRLSKPFCRCDSAPSHVKRRQDKQSH